MNLEQEIAERMENLAVDIAVSEDSVQRAKAYASFKPQAVKIIKSILDKYEEEKSNPTGKD